MFTPLNIEAITYMSIINKVKSFVSFDISKNSTGITHWKDGKLTIEHFGFKDDDDTVEIRRKFREKVMFYIGDGVEYTFIEGTIGSVNYKTASILYQLNVVVDDLNDMGIIKAGTIIRPDNTEWKSWLEQVSGYEKKIRAEIHTKQVTQDCLRLIGYTEPFATDDESDSLGMAVGTIFAKVLNGVEQNKEKRAKKAKLKDDITKGYIIKQFSNVQDLMKYCKPFTDIHQIDCTNITKDFKKYFKDIVQSVGDDKVFVVKIKTTKLGTLILQYDLNVHIEESFLFVIKKGNMKNKKK